MTDYRSAERLEIWRSERLIGILRRLPRGSEFTYQSDFLQSSEMPLALHLPKTSEPLITEGVLNLPTYFAGLLPEGVMFTAAQKLIGSAKDDLFAVLAATGRDAIGDVEIRVPGESLEESSDFNLEKAEQALELLLRTAKGPIERITGISGVQPKMSIGGIVRASRSSQFIAKFPTEEFPGLPENELACMNLARRCGLQGPRTQVRNGIYIVERFDRQTSEAGQTTKIHVEDMLQVMDLFPNQKYGVDFVEVSNAMARIGVSSVGILDTIRLYAFSYLIGNGDLHAKNVSVIRKRNGQWILSPVYDIVSTLPYGNVIVGADAMAIPLADEAIGRFEMGDFLSFGELFGIPPRAVEKMISRLAKSVSRFAPAALAKVLTPNQLDTVISRCASLTTSPN